MFPALPATLLLLVSLVGLTLIRHCQRKMRKAQREAKAAQQATRDAEGRRRSPCPGRGQVCRNR